MRTLKCGLALAFLCACMLGQTGCGTDNETDAKKLQSSTGPIPEAKDPAAKPQATKPMSSMEDYAKQRTGASTYAGTKLDPNKKK